MKRTFLLVLTAMILASCSTSGGGGELVGVEGRRAYPEPDPYGMVAIPMGSFAMGPSDQDITWTQNSLTRTVAVDAFWMDETEITNNEYRQFVYWVRDSIIRKRLAAYDEALYAKQNEETGTIYDTDDEPVISWDAEIDYSDITLREEIEETGIYFSREETLSSYSREYNPETFVYRYSWVNFNKAAKGRANGERVPRSELIEREELVVYPDTLVWVRDFTYSYNEPMTNMYFSSPAYDYYPVVGVTWHQAKAFSAWRTNYLNKALFESGQTIVQDYRMPSEAEWEYAARGGLDHAMYPWGGPYLRNKLGCFIANFKPLRGNYTDDGNMYPGRVGYYGFPNEFLLYDMAGNVAEWTITSYDPSASVFSHDLNPYFTYDAQDDDPVSMKRKVVRGGSWKDVARYLQVGTRDYEYQDTAKSYIGFRCVRSYLGDN